MDTLTKTSDSYIIKYQHDLNNNNWSQSTDVFKSLDSNQDIGQVEPKEEKRPVNYEKKVFNHFNSQTWHFSSW